MNVDHLHEHFVDPVVVRQGRYGAPSRPDYRFDQEAGGVQGHQIANYVLGHVLGDLNE